jgi:hypothetical protein
VATPLTHNSTSPNNQTTSCQFISAANASISIGSGATLIAIDCSISATNANAITGSGTLLYTPLAFTSTGVTINPSTQTLKVFGPKMYVPNGISFDNTNFLANYAQGTWTPTMQGSVTGGTTTYTVQAGTYTRIGNRCFISGEVEWSAATGTGNTLIGGLPFTVNSSDLSGMAFNVVQTIAVGTGLVPLLGTIASSTNMGLATYNPITGGYSAVAVASAGNLAFSGSFQI